MSRTIPARLAVFILILGNLIQFDPRGNFHVARLGPWAFVVASLEGSREGTLQRERVGSGTCCERGEAPLQFSWGHFPTCPNSSPWFPSVPARGYISGLPT